MKKSILKQIKSAFLALAVILNINPVFIESSAQENEIIQLEAESADSYSTNILDTSQSRIRRYSFAAAQNGYAVGWNSGEWICYNLNFLKSGKYTVKVRCWGADTANIGAFINSESIGSADIPNTGSWQPTAPCEVIVGEADIEAGSFKLKLQMLSGGSTVDCVYLQRISDYPSWNERKIQAEAFNLYEGQNEGYFDTTPDKTDNTWNDQEYSPVEVGNGNGGKVIGMLGSEWLKYNVTAPRDGEYSLTICHSGPDDTIIKAYANDSDAISFSMPKASQSGYSNYVETNLGNVTLKAGINKLKIENSGEPINFDYFILEKIQTEYDTLRMDAVNFNSGGQGIGYYDTTTGIDSDRDYAVNDGDVEIISSDEKNAVLMLDKEWLKYDVNIVKSGYYYLDIDAISFDNSLLSISTEDTLTQKNLHITDSYQNKRILVKLFKGVQSIKIKLDGGKLAFRDFEINYIDSFSEIDNNDLCNRLSQMEFSSQLEKYIDENEAFLAIEALNDKNSIFYFPCVFDNIVGTSYTDITGFISAYNKSVYDNILDPSVKLYIDNEITNTLKSGYASIKVDTSSLPYGVCIFAAIYENENQKLVSVGNVYSSSDEEIINFGNISLNDSFTYSLKIFTWDNCDNIKPYSALSAINIYVSPDGDDNNKGSEKEPLKTISKAQELVRNYNVTEDKDINVNIQSGNYYLSEPLMFTPLDSAKDGHVVTYRGNTNDKPVINGGVKVDQWQKFDENIYVSQLNDVDDMRHLYVNSKSAKRASSSVKYKGFSVYDDENNLTDNDGILILSSKVPDGLYDEKNLELVWDIHWTRQRIPVKSIIKKIYSSSDALVLEDNVSPYYQYAVTKSYDGTTPSYSREFSYENAFCLLDEPGEFYFDKDDKKLYYYPRENEDLSIAQCYIGQSEGLLNICGNDDSDRVKNLKFENLDFRYGDWLEINSRGMVITQGDKIVNSLNEPVSNGGLMMKAQIELNWAENIDFCNNTVANCGSAALSMSKGVKNCVVQNNEIFDTSAGGIIVGDWNHSFVEYNPLMCTDIEVKNNSIKNVSWEYSSSPAVSVYYTNGVDISHNDIENTAYSGISMGWGWNNGINYSGNNTIEYNKIKNVMTELQDGAHIYTLGAMPNTFIRGNYLIKSDDYGGIYLDQGSSYMQVNNNVISGCTYWLFARAGVSITGVTGTGNYTDSQNSDIDTDNVILTDTLYCENSIWPTEANDIIENSGIKR